MAQYNLVMTFKTSGGSTANLTVKDVWPLIEKANVATLMDTIIEQNVFETKTGDLVAKSSAKIVKSESVKHEMV